MLPCFYARLQLLRTGRARRFSWHPGDSVRCRSLTHPIGFAPAFRVLYAPDATRVEDRVLTGLALPRVVAQDGQSDRGQERDGDQVHQRHRAHERVDAGYRGEDRGKEWVEKALGWSVELVERPRKPAPKEVLMRWAEQWSHDEGVVVDWEKLLPPKGFVVLPRRWVVERSFAWIGHNRRMSKDYERLCASGEAFVYAAMSRLMLRRLACA